MKVIITTGYFNPLHSKHIEYLNKAKTFGDYLIVILNNDYQVELKKSIKFFDQNERFQIVSNLKPVDEVILSIDKDSTVLETLKYIRKNHAEDELIFVKSGDRTPENTLELELLNNLEFKCHWNIIEYDKTISSTIIKNKINNEK